ncbi:hypothetical protein JW898_00045 [Candidatus Woesearchaeota archaeon]|nr:hypothetical protein [Candidatus Woesearchaeota archaeon]
MRCGFLAVLVVISLLLLVGCKEDVLQGQQVDEVIEPLPAPEPMEVHAAELPGQRPEIAAEPEEEKPSEPFCGDGVCSPEKGENCDRCAKDCACESPAECYRAECKVPECGSNGDCRDDDACTVDTCFFAQHPNAYCGHELIKSCKNNDGCCPEGCDANTDTDCEPVCGNHACEPGENSSNCDDDCPARQAAGSVCGDGKCEAGEDMTSCPRDCP